MTLQSSPLKAAGSISLATLVSRVLGLVRDQVQAYFFGAGVTTDAFVAAFRIPNLFRDMFAEGALSAAFVPTFTAEMERGGKEAAWRLANRVITLMVIVLGGLTLLIFFFAPGILRVYAAGFDPEKRALAVAMTRIVSPFLLFVALAAVAMGALNARGRFFLPALAPAFFNVSFILGILLLYPVLRHAGLNPGLSLAIGALVGGALQWVVQIPALWREGFRFRPRIETSDPALRRVGRVMVPATFGLAATQINILVDTVLASFMGDAPITWLSYAFRMMQLPLGLFGVAIATANLAHVSRDVARSDMEGLRGNLSASLRGAAILTLPATVGLLALRTPIVRVIFEHGEFTARDTLQTAAAVGCYALSLYAYSVTKIQVPTFYALGDTRLPVIVAAVSVAVKISANLLLIGWLPRIGLEPFLGLALSTSLAAWINFALLSRGLRRRIGDLSRYAVVSTTIKLALFSIGMGVVCGGFHGLLERHLGGGGLPGEIARLGTAIALGIGLVGWAAHLMKLPEIGALRISLRSLLGDRKGD